MQNDKFSRIVRSAVLASDVVLHVIDARLGRLTVSNELVSLCKGEEKRIVYVINKVDLVPQSAVRRLSQKIKPSVALDSKTRAGLTALRNLIYKAASKNKKDDIIVSVIGYPNVGKSSVINALKGSHSAKASSRSGTTKGVQHVRATSRIVLHDTPGVLPKSNLSSVQFALLDAKNPDHVRDPEGMAIEILQILRELNGDRWFVSTFSVDWNELDDDVLESIATQQNRLLKGGVPDTKLVARKIIAQWHKGAYKKKKQ